MAEHEVAALQKQEQEPETSGAEATACWGTCEELLLVSAVKRHGVKNWNLIASELKARAITLNVSPLYFSETACKHKYDVLRGRFASCSSSTISQDEEVENDMHWFEELRKIRVAHLKRELEQYDGSIGSLQVKIKRLKAEKAGDTAANKQLGKSVAGPKPKDQVREASTCEVPVQCSSIDNEFGKDLSKSSVLKPGSQASLALHKEKNLHDNAEIQDPVKSRRHVHPEGDQWHDAVEELQDASSAPIDITVDADVHRDSHQPDNTTESSTLDHGVEGDDGTVCVIDTVIIEPQVPLEGALDELQGVEAAGVAPSPVVNENKVPEKSVQSETEKSEDLMDKSAESPSRDREADLLVPDSVNEEKPKAGITVDQGTREMPQNESIIVQPDPILGGDDRTLSATADAISNVDTCENGVTVLPIDSDLRIHAEGHSIVSPTSSSPSSQPSGSRNLGEAGDKQSETSTNIEGNEVPSNSQHDAHELQRKTVEDAVDTSIPREETDSAVGLSTQLHAVLAHDTEHGHSTGKVSSPSLERDNIGDAQVSHQIDESVSDLTQDAKVDEIVSSEPPLESSKLHEHLPNAQVLNEVPTSGSESAEACPEANTAAAEGVRMSQEDGMIISEKPESEEPAQASGLLHPPGAELKRSSPEGHIVIALDGPIDDVPSCEMISVPPTSAQGEMVSKVELNIGSDAVNGLEAGSVEGKEQLVETSCQDVASGGFDGKTAAHVSSADANNLLKEECGTLPSTASEGPLISVELVRKPEPEKTAATLELPLPSGMEASNLTNYGPAVSDQVENAMETLETMSKVVDEPPTSELDVKTDFGQVAQDSEIGHNVGDVEHNDSHAVIAAVLPTPGSLPVGHTEIDPASKYGRDSPGFQGASIGQERKLQGIILDVKLEISKEESLEGQTSICRQHPSEVVSDGSRGRDLDISSTSSPSSAKERDQSDKGLVMESTVLKPLTISPAKVKEEIIEYVRDRNLQEIMDIAPKSGIKLKAEPNSPVESLAGGLESKVPSSHEGSDSVQEQSKDGDQSRERGERRQRLRDDGESQIDKSEAGSLEDGNDGTSPSSRRNRREPRVPGKLVPLLEVLRNICNHKSAHLFKARPEDPRYIQIIRRHMDLTMVRARLEEGVYSGSSEFFRDLLLIFNNSMVFYPPGSTEFVGAKALFVEATKELDRVSQTEALLKRDGPATRTRELKRPKLAPVVAAPAKVVAPSPIVGTSSGKLVGSNPSATSLLDNTSRKRPSTRSGALETSTNSGAVVDSEGGAARSASVNIIGGPSTSRAEETRDSHDGDQEVNGRLKGGPKLHVGGGSSKVVTTRQEELEGKNGVSKAVSGRAKLRDLKEAEVATKQPAKAAAGGGKLKAERENERKREKERDKEKEKLKVSERDDIDDDDLLLRKGKSLAKLKDQEIVQERVSKTKPASRARTAAAAARSASNSQTTPAQSHVRPVRGAARKAAAAASSAKDVGRAPEPQPPKKRVRK